MGADPFSGAAVTALGLAAARSVESGRPDRLVTDPLARRLYLAAGRDLPMRLDWPAPHEPLTATEALHLHGSCYIGLRTRFYDDALTDAVENGVRQAVLLGSGLDTRAYRLSLPPDLRVFELDQSDLLAWKRGTIGGFGVRSNCRVHDLGLDVREDWTPALRAAGFDSGRSAVVIAEGLLPYLGPEQQLELVDRLTAVTAEGSAFVADRIAGDPHTDGRLEKLSQRSGIDMHNLIASGEASLLDALSQRGWHAEERPVAALAASYARDLSDPFATASSDAGGEPPWLDTTFITARRGC